MHKLLLLFIIIFLQVNCTRIDKNKLSNNKSKISYKFQPPTLINSLLTDSSIVGKYNVKEVTSVLPKFIGKFKYQDTIDIAPNKRDSAFYLDRISEYAYIGIDDSIDVNGFELIVDYNTSIAHREVYFLNNVFIEYYPVYFVNSSSSDKMFLGKDNHIFGIQEMYVENHYCYRPIEVRMPDFCGNGRWGVKVRPNEFVIVLMKKYDGNFKTKLRTRFKIGESIYVSMPFYGIVNRRQYQITDSSLISDISNRKENFGLFYGANPTIEE